MLSPHQSKSKSPERKDPANSGNAETSEEAAEAFETAEVEEADTAERGEAVVDMAVVETDARADTAMLAIGKVAVDTEIVAEKAAVTENMAQAAAIMNAPRIR